MTSTANATLERFREAAASGHPTPAGVAVAAVSASLAVGLLAKALTVSGRKEAHSDDRAQLESLVAAARAESSRLLQLADDDTAAFEAFLTATRSPRSTDPERLERQQAIDSALRRTIDVPLAAARSAAAGVRLCAEAVSMTHLVVLADLAVAATLLTSALRAFLLCAESNVEQLAPAASSYRAMLVNEVESHKQTLREAESVLERVATTLRIAVPGPQSSQP